jgi:hypothetical protein
MAKPMSFDDYRKSKSKHWKSLVSKGTKKGKMSPQEITIIISLYEWNDKGKRILLKVSPVDPYARILEKAVTKWSDFHSDCFNEEEDHVLLAVRKREGSAVSTRRKGVLYVEEISRRSWKRIQQNYFISVHSE